MLIKLKDASQQINDFQIGNSRMDAVYTRKQ